MLLLFFPSNGAPPPAGPPVGSLGLSGMGR